MLNRSFFDSLCQYSMMISLRSTCCTNRFRQLLSQQKKSSLHFRSLSTSSLLVGPPTSRLVPPGECQFGEDFESVPLLNRTLVSHNSSVLRFGLPDASKPLNLSTCACILAKSDDIEGQKDAVIRPYTPISTNAQVGSFDLLVKNYGSQGLMSRHLHEISVGDSIDFKHIPPNVKIQAPFSQKHVVMLAGGTGIGPMIQALHAILDNTNEEAPKQRVTLFYGSQTKDDILGFDLLQQWERDYSEQLKVVHVLSDEITPAYRSGFIDKNLLQEYAPTIMSDDTLVLICGPPPLYHALSGPRDDPELTGVLAELGCSTKQVYKF
jgi:cytochrome-b5 reductase